LSGLAGFLGFAVNTVLFALFGLFGLFGLSILNRRLALAASVLGTVSLGWGVADRGSCPNDKGNRKAVYRMDQQYLDKTAAP